MHQDESKVQVLRASIINALLPKFLKHIFLNGLFFIVLFIIYLAIEHLSPWNLRGQLVFWGITLTVLISFLKISKRLILIYATEYKFHEHNVEKEFSFFIKESHSIAYSKITDIQVIQSIWDRVCGVGDLILHTANEAHHDENVQASIKLSGISNPESIKRQIMQRVHHTAHTQHHN
jgi:uncharacterized membrane protein YdbT with pleckstrin-like domain